MIAINAQPAISIEEGAVESYPGYFNPAIARMVGMSVLPELLINPDRNRRLGDNQESGFYDHTGYRLSRIIEGSLIVSVLDERLLPNGDVSVSRARYMSNGVRSGWHCDDVADIRCIVGYLGTGELFIRGHTNPIPILPGTVVRINNTIPARLEHDAVSRSKHRVVGVYGRHPL